MKDLVQDNYSGLIGALPMIFIVTTFKIRILMKITVSNGMVSSQVVSWIIVVLLLCVITLLASFLYLFHNQLYILVE